MSKIIQHKTAKIQPTVAAWNVQ